MEAWLALCAWQKCRCSALEPFLQGEAASSVTLVWVRAVVAGPGKLLEGAKHGSLTVRVRAIVNSLATWQRSPAEMPRAPADG